MDSKIRPDTQHPPTLEESIANLHINEPVNSTAETVNSAQGESIESNSPDKEHGPLNEVSNLEASPVPHGEAVGKILKDDELLPENDETREMEIARTEAQNSSGDAHVVPTREYRSRVVGDGEEKEVVPTGIVHENADPKEKDLQQSKGVLQTVTGKLSQTVRSVFGGRIGSKSSNNLEVKKKVYDE